MLMMIISGPCLKAEEAMEHEGDDDTNFSCALGTIPKGLVRDWKTLKSEKK